MNKANINIKTNRNVDLKQFNSILKNNKIQLFINVNQLTNSQIVQAIPVFVKFTKVDTTRYIAQLDWRNEIVRLELIPTKLTQEGEKYQKYLLFGTLQDPAIKFDALSSNKKHVHKILSDKLNPENKEGAYFYGDFGTGKTFSMQILANEYVNLGQTVIFASMTDILNELKNEMNTNIPRLMKMLETVDNLFIDDIGAENFSNWVLEVLTNILNQRWQNQKRTFFTSNFDTRDLMLSYIKRIQLSGKFDSVGSKKGILRLRARLFALCQIYNFDKLLSGQIKIDKPSKELNESH
jgi:DNA replication protein DnaC